MHIAAAVREKMVGYIVTQFKLYLLRILPTDVKWWK